MDWNAKRRYSPIGFTRASAASVSGAIHAGTPSLATEFTLPA